MKRFLLLLVITPLWAANYADELLDQYAEHVTELSGQSDPLAKTLLAESIYFISHETARQDTIVALLKSLYDDVNHQEARAEIGHFLAQMHRQLGNRDAVAKMTKELGYVPEWRVLGPLAPDRNLDPEALVSVAQTPGLDRPVQPRMVRAYGEQDFWGRGIGQYGYFAANQAVYPNQLAGALFTTWFEAPTTGVYRIGLGWSHFAKVWVDRSLVFEGLEKQEPRPDQAMIDLELRRGMHRLVLYVESPGEGPNLGFFARVTGPDGQPLTFDSNRDKRPKRRAPKVVDGETTLTELAAAHSDYALATVLLIKEQRFHAEHGSPKEILQRAFDAEPNRSTLLKLNNLTEDANEKLAYLRTFLAKVGEDRTLERAWAMTELGQLALDQQRFWEARRYADQARQTHPDFWPAQILKNNVLSALGLYGEALRGTSDLLTQYPDLPWLMMDISDLYWSLDFDRESEDMTERVLKIRRTNNKFAERKIAILKRRGDVEALDTFYAGYLDDTPYSTNLVLSYARFLIANRRLDQADTLLAGRLEQLPQNPFLLEGMGELRQQQGRPEAIDYFERALALRPQNPALEKRLALTRSEQKAFYADYKIEQAPDVNILEVAPIAINFENTVTKVAPNGQSSVYRQIEYDVITEQGAQELPGYSFSYAPLRQNGEVLRAEIYRGDQTIPLTRYGRQRISDPAYRMYYDVVAYQIPFPALQAGDRVRVEYRIDDIDRTNIYGDYFGDLQYFAERYPIRRKSYTLIMPKSRTVYKHVERMTPEYTETQDDENNIYTWTLDQIGSIETEARMPGVAGYLPYVGVSTFNDWQAMARWYHELIKEQLILDNETKAIVRDLVDGITDPLEIVKKVHEYVIENTRYVALEFGIHGYKPYEVNQVCTRQFGDCKDKASLIVAMLREAGVDSSIVIIRTSDRGEVYPFPAMLSYFNHAIAYVPQFDLYLDGTAEFSGIDELPEMDQNALVLIVDQNGDGKLTRTPYLRNNLQSFDLAVDVLADGAAEVRGKVFYQGAINPELRQYLAIETKLTDNLENILGQRMPGIDILEAEREGYGINNPITLKFSGRTDRLLQRNADRIQFPLNVLNDPLVRNYAPNARRKFPIDLGSPSAKEIEMRLAAPSGYALADKPEPLLLEDENMAVTIQLDEEGPGAYKVFYRIAFKQPMIEPEQYDAFREMMQAHDRWLDQSLNFVAQ